MQHTSDTSSQSTETPDTSLQSIENSKALPSIGNFLTENWPEFFNVIVPLIRVVITNTIVFLVFYVGDLVFLYLIELSAQDLISIPFVNWLLLGLKVFSLLGIGVYYIITTIGNLKTQYSITQNIEERAGFDEYV